MKIHWYEVFEHVRAVSLATMYANVPVAVPCPACGQVTSGTYQDIRNRERCNRCHSLMQD